MKRNMNKTLSPQELDCYPLFHLFKKNHQKQYNIKFQKSIGFTISFYTFCLNNKENASGNKTRVRRLRHTLNKSKLMNH